MQLKSRYMLFFHYGRPENLKLFTHACLKMQVIGFGGSCRHCHLMAAVHGSFLKCSLVIKVEFTELQLANIPG